MKAALIAEIVVESEDLGNGNESALAVIGLNDNGYQPLQGANNRVLDFRAEIAHLIEFWKPVCAHPLFFVPKLQFFFNFGANIFTLMLDSEWISGGPQCSTTFNLIVDGLFDGEVAQNVKFLAFIHFVSHFGKCFRLCFSIYGSWLLHYLELRVTRPYLIIKTVIETFAVNSGFENEPPQHAQDVARIFVLDILSDLPDWLHIFGPLARFFRREIAQNFPFAE